jgi:hypothetical protein
MLPNSDDAAAKTIADERIERPVIAHPGVTTPPWALDHLAGK